MAEIPSVAEACCAGSEPLVPFTLIIYDGDRSPDTVVTRKVVLVSIAFDPKCLGLDASVAEIPRGIGSNATVMSPLNVLPVVSVTVAVADPPLETLVGLNLRIIVKPLVAGALLQFPARWQIKNKLPAGGT